MLTGALSVISAGPTGTIGPLGSSSAVTSADDRYIAFTSGNDLSDDDTNGQSDTYRHDRLTGEKIVISVSSDGTAPNGVAYPLSVSSGGRYTLGYSNAENLVTDDTNGRWDIFVFDTGPQGEMLVSTMVAGQVGELTYGPHDILQWDGETWTKWFDGAAAGLLPERRFKHNINTIWISDTQSAEVLMSFSQTRQQVGTLGWVDGFDILHWDGTAFSRWFEGERVGLDNRTQEKIDGLHVLAEAPSWSEFAGRSCRAYLLVSTQGPGLVPKPGNIKPRNVLKFGGEDVLGFCATNLGVNTTGFWEMVLDGSTLGVTRNNIDTISLRDDARQLYLTSRKAFSVDQALGDYSHVYIYDFDHTGFVGTAWSAFDVGMTAGTRLDALQVVGTAELR